MMEIDSATKRQVSAAHPTRSAWVAANAGSGKTRVLTDRVARLLLEGVEPQNILCLTYTKAAANEMQNRLLQRLGKWSMLKDARLREELDHLGVSGSLANLDLRKARRLFARAIEAPGGLRILTIHSFCASILRLFPLEARVSPQFREMDDRNARQLRAETLEEIASGPNADKLGEVCRFFTGASVDDLSAEIVQKQQLFTSQFNKARLAAHLGLSKAENAEKIAGRVFLGNEQEIFDRLLAALTCGSVNDKKAAEKLSVLKNIDYSALGVLEDVFLSGPKTKIPFGAKIGTFPTKPCREQLTEILPQLDNWMLRVEEAREGRLALETLERTQALHSFAHVFLATYNSTKLDRGLLDFDDLILHTRDLLTDPAVAAWVLYKLDGGIDHILVDEAQDTSPAQWQVIELLAQEFTSGEGARADRLRTVFVVGDKKQSIYSFQGADPREFDRMQQEFSKRLAYTRAPLDSLHLEHSFRSSSAILDLVDATFAGASESGFASEQKHRAFHTDLPGRVDLWPALEKPAKPEDPPWYMPVDIASQSDPAVLLANQIADEIARLSKEKHAIPDLDTPAGWRQITPGDFLILVQRRSALFHEIIRACKARNLPVAGADRLKVAGELAVKDLRAALSFLAMPEDDLSLAIALRSPLFGWSEEGIFELAHGRKQKYLWAELRDRSKEFSETYSVLRDLFDTVDFLRPYELTERILTRHEGRRKLLGQLGPEAEDGIDAFLAQTLEYERQSVDSLTGFLVWMDRDDLEVKRQLDNSEDRIRVMTVHGSKGLESPIVILPDTAKRTITVRNPFVASEDLAIWKGDSTEMPRKLTGAVEAIKVAQQSERDRLLYVAMTRAEKWLIVAAMGDLGSENDSWYEKLRKGMVGVGASDHTFSGGTGLRFEYGNWNVKHLEPAQGKPGVDESLDSMFLCSAPTTVPSKAALNPSKLGGPKALPGDKNLEEDTAMRHGTMVHKLLEVLPGLPMDSWRSASELLLSVDPVSADTEDISLAFEEATKVLSSPELGRVFQDNALIEVPVSASLRELGGNRIHGVIDRLIIENDRILIVDFKTNEMVPDEPARVPIGLLRQMGAYVSAVGEIYPGRLIESAILWTKAPQLMMLPHDIVTDALLNTQMS